MEIRGTYLNDSHVGSIVTYHNIFGGFEVGKIKSWNDEYIFVTYDHCSNRGLATNPNNLYFGDRVDELVTKFKFIERYKLKDIIKIDDESLSITTDNVYYNNQYICEYNIHINHLLDIKNNEKEIRRNIQIAKLLNYGEAKYK